MSWRALLLSFLLAGCTQLQPTPQDLQAKKFEAVADKAVIYLVRDYPDHSNRQAMLQFGDGLILKTYPGTYYRWEVPPGAHRIAGYAGDNGVISVQAEAGRIYFVRQQVSFFPLNFSPQSYFYLVDEPYGRAAVMRAVLLTAP